MFNVVSTFSCPSRPAINKGLKPNTINNEAVAIAEGIEHENIDVTYHYAHMFPTKQSEIANKLNSYILETDKEMNEVYEILLIVQEMNNIQNYINEINFDQYIYNYAIAKRL